MPSKFVSVFSSPSPSAAMLLAAGAADSQYVQESTELRSQVARALGHASTPIVNDAVAVLPFAGLEALGPDSSNRLARQILQLLVSAAQAGELDADSAGLADMRISAQQRQLTIPQLFSLVYLVERAALDQLAVDDSFGASSEAWPSVAQIVRRSSFSVLAAYADRLDGRDDRDALTDPLTTLHTRAVLTAATEKEIQRSERLGHPFGIILVDIDRLSEINARHGYGSGDRVLERLGILIRNYFREQDWVARFSGDAFAVLLPETLREHAVGLAERVRTTVESRMALHDYRSEQEIPLTVSVGVVFVASVDRGVDAEHLFDEARQAADRAKRAGRNRVEIVDISITRPLTPPARDITPLG